MSGAPASLAPSAASSEAFVQPSSVNHGVSDLSAGLFQSLQLERESDGRSRRRETQKGDVHKGKNRGVLNPFAKEFTPVAGSTFQGILGVSQRHKSVGVDSHPKKAGARDKGPKNGGLWRSKWDQDGNPGSIVNAKEGYNESRFTDPSFTSSGAELSSAFASSRSGSSYGGQDLPFEVQSGQGSGVRIQVGGAGGSSSNGRKGQGLSANHLLNFYYDPIPRPPPHVPVRRPRKVQPYNKELFLQANFRFLVSDLGDYLVIASDPDKMLQWEDVAAVNLSAPQPVQCPICLDSPPLCTQITTCGHIFCLPCILRYLMMGDHDVRGDHWKKCPLCFAMISCKDLRTLIIDNVKQHSVGERLSFCLLMRAKGSIIPFEKAQLKRAPLAHSKDGQCHLFSKLTLTSDAETTTKKAVNDLTSWAQRVQLEGGEDLELLPYVFAGIEQLQQRKIAWTEHRATEFLSSSPPVRQRIMAQSKVSNKLPGDSSFHASRRTLGLEGEVEVDGFSSVHQKKADLEKVDIVSQTEAAMAELKEKAGWVYESAFSDDEDNGLPSRMIKGLGNSISGDANRNDVFASDILLEEAPDDWGDIMTYPDREDFTATVESEKKYQEVKDFEERDLYTFYQSVDGQTIILHPLNVKCLLNHYGSYEALPPRLEGEILELETLTQSNLTRKRYRYLSHLPLTAIFQETKIEMSLKYSMAALVEIQASSKEVWDGYLEITLRLFVLVLKLCEVDLSKLLPSIAFMPFAEELHVREARRRRLLKQEKNQKAMEERAGAAKASRLPPPSPSDFTSILAAIQMEGVPTSSDFEDSLGDSPVVVISPAEVEERKLFSRVAKLGFAAGCDAPDLKKLGSDTAMGYSPSPPTTASPWASGLSVATEAGPSKAPAMSFADIIQSQAMKTEQDDVPSVAVRSGTKKGRKASKIIMSTAGGRRY